MCAARGPRGDRARTLAKCRYVGRAARGRAREVLSQVSADDTQLRLALRSGQDRKFFGASTKRHVICETPLTFMAANCEGTIQIPWICGDGPAAFQAFTS